MTYSPDKLKLINSRPNFNPGMVEKAPLTKAELTRLADILLSRHGFSYDGRPKRLLQKKAKAF
jgi:hypothetical protein